MDPATRETGLITKCMEREFTSIRTKSTGVEYLLMANTIPKFRRSSKLKRSSKIRSALLKPKQNAFLLNSMRHFKSLIRKLSKIT